MRGCNLPYYDCELERGDFCECVHRKNICTHGFVYGETGKGAKYFGIEPEILKLVAEDAHDWGYKIFGIEGFLEIINRRENRERGKDGQIELGDNYTQSLSKYTEESKFIPFNEAIAETSAGIGAIDLKRFKYSDYCKRTHAMQAIGYCLSICQMYDLHPQYFFPIIINRPFRKKPGSYRRFDWHILKIEPSDERVKEVIDEMKKTYYEQNLILIDNNAFQEELEKQVNSECHGCFEGEFCKRLQADLAENKKTLEEYLIGDLKVLPDEYHLRWSEINKECLIGRIYAKIDKQKLPQHLKVPDNKLSLIGTALHSIFNTQHRKNFYHNNSLKEIGVKPAPRDNYCERELVYYLDGIKITGHADSLILNIEFGR